MKIVVNTDYGGFSLGCPEWVWDYSSIDKRTAPKLVNFVEKHPDSCGDLKVKTIPDEATDWDLFDYDGHETVVYVLDGKLHYV